MSIKPDEQEIEMCINSLTIMKEEMIESVCYHGRNLSHEKITDMIKDINVTLLVLNRALQ